MKIIKKISLTLLIVLVFTSVAGYIYFEQKFTPDKNYLIVANESGKIPLTWIGADKNGLLLPIHILGNKQTYYLQFDTGSPYTILYAKSISTIKGITVNKNTAKTSFTLGKTKITSTSFKMYDYQVENNKNDTLKIIGTLGSDLLENRKTIINFKENNIIFNIQKFPTSVQKKLFDFTFKKRKIIINGLLKGKSEKFLFDTGTSAFELLTNKNVWNNLKNDNATISIEKSKSLQNILTTFTANCNQKIKFNTKEVALKKVTYVEGFSQTQYLLMKLSGMTGMLGNKIFLNNIIYIDSEKNKIAIE